MIYFNVDKMFVYKSGNFVIFEIFLFYYVVLMVSVVVYVN